MIPSQKWTRRCLRKRSTRFCAPKGPNLGLLVITAFTFTLLFAPLALSALSALLGVEPRWAPCLANKIITRTISSIVYCRKIMQRYEYRHAARISLLLRLPFGNTPHPPTQHRRPSRTAASCGRFCNIPLVAVYHYAPKYKECLY